MNQSMRYVTGIISFTLTLLISACGGGGGGSSDTNNPTGSTTLPDTSAPSIVSRSPVPGATKVARDIPVSVVFSEDMYSPSINSVTFEVIDPVLGVPLSGSLSYNTSNRTASFSRGTPFAEYSTYTVILDGVVDTTLNALPYSEWTFRTADETAPITTNSLDSGYYNTPQSAVLTCDDGDGSGCEAIYYTLDGTTPTTGSPTYTGPVGISTLNTEVTLKFFAVDAEGNSESVQTSTYVIDTIPPTVSATTPLTDETSVTLTDNLVITFSEPVNPVTVSETSVKLNAADHTIVGKVSLDANAINATFRPDDRLECNTLYTATVTTAVTDRAGNPLATEYSWDFTTHEDCSEPKTAASPFGGVFRTASLDVNLSCTDNILPATGCTRLVYTTDGSVPSFDPPNGNIIESGNTSISLGIGDTTLMFAAQDAAGNTEAVKEALYSLSDTGFTYVATEVGLSRGIGPIPDSFVNTKSMHAADYANDPLVIDQSNGRMYATGSLAFSDDGGRSWARRSSAHGLRSGADTLYARGSRVYVGGFRGVDISTDGGASFKPSTTSIPYSIESIYVLGNTVFASTSTAIWRSTDRGNTFSEVYNADVVRMNGYGNTLYAATRSNGLLVSTDGGNTFTLRPVPGGNSIYIRDLFITTDNTLYLATSAGIAITSDQGQSYTSLTTTNGLTSDNVTAVAVSGSDVYAAIGASSGDPNSKSIAISRDGGTTFTETTSMYEGLAGSDVWDLKMIDTRLWAYTGSGLSYSDDFGASFTSIGLGDNSVQDVVADANGRLYVATGYSVYYRNAGGIAVSDDGGYSFTNLNMGQGLPSFVANRLNVSPDGNTIHVTTDFIGNSLTAGYALSANGGVTFEQPMVPPSDSVWKARGPLAVNGNHVYIAAGAEGYGYYVSHDSGTSFTMHTMIDTLDVSHAFDVAVGFDGTVYLSTHQGIAISTDNGDTFDMMLTTANGLGSDSIGTLHVNDTTIYAEVNYISNGDWGLAYSVDNGASFTTLTTADGLPDNSISSVDTFSGYLYVGTFGGLAISADQGASFTVRTEADGLGYNIPRAALYLQ